MNIKLSILSIWLPKFLQKKELEKTSRLTNDCLDSLLKNHNIKIPEKTPPKKSLVENRLIMANEHNKKVMALIKAIGYENALQIGRSGMFKVGCIMGREARERLRIGDKIEDTIAAARILYKILGIDFTIEKKDHDMIFKVHSCALSNRYTPETCQIMSAADKGVLKGLNENLDLDFKNMITEGAEECTACIKIKSGVEK